MKKILSLLLAASLAMSCAATAFAEDAGLELNVSGPEGETTVQTAETAVADDALLPPIEDYTAYSDPALQAEIDALLNSLAAEEEAAAQTYNADSVATYDANLDSYSKNLEGFVTRMYKLVLNRDPDKAGFNDWVSKLRSGAAKGADIVFGFFASNEYQSRNRSNEQTVTDCYNAILGRSPDSAGLQDWCTKMTNGVTAMGIANGFVGSQEFIRLCSSYGITAGSMPVERLEWRDRNANVTNFVSRMYTKCLGRSYDVAGLNNWTAALIVGSVSGADVASGFVFSTEYKNKHVSNLDYVVMLYSTFFGRTPDSAGLMDWVTKLNYTSSRESVLNGFLGSQEFASLCREAGIAVGNMVATPDGTTAWKANISMLALINGQRVGAGLSMLTLRQDLYDVATLRASELPTRYKNSGKNDEWRPNGQNFQTAYNDKGLGSAPEKYEARVRDTSSSGLDAIVNALLSTNSIASRSMLMSSTVNTFAVGYLEQDGAKWYAVEVARI